MAHFSVTTDTIVTSGDGRTLVAVADTLFVGRNATLGSAALDGRGVVMQAASQMVNVAGTIIGATGIDAVGTGGTITILTRGTSAQVRRRSTRQMACLCAMTR